MLGPRWGGRWAPVVRQPWLGNESRGRDARTLSHNKSCSVLSCPPDRLGSNLSGNPAVLWHRGS